MKYSVQVHVMPLKELLDPQGKAVLGGLKNLGLKALKTFVWANTFRFQVEAASEEEAQRIAEEASKKLLANPVMEYYEIQVEELIS